MDETSAGSNPIQRSLRDPIWQGIGGIAAIIALVVPLTIAAWELVTGNVRLLLWLQASVNARYILLAILLIVCLGAGYIVVAWRTVQGIGYFDNRQSTFREPRYSGRKRLNAFFIVVLTLALAVVVEAGYSFWVNLPSQKTVVLIADFLDPNRQDSMAVTRELVTQISDILAEYPDIQVMALGWPIENRRGEGSDDARRIGELVKANIVIWGDYRIEPDLVTFVHFDLITARQPFLEVESYKVYGDEQIQQVAAAEQQLALPETVAFNVALGEHLGTLVAFAGGLAFTDSSNWVEARRLFDIASQVYGNPLSAQIAIAIHLMRGVAYQVGGDADIAASEYTAVLDTLALPPVQSSHQLSLALILNNRGVARGDQGDLAGAISDYDQAIALDPQYAAAYINRGNARNDQGDLAGAISDYDQAIALDPQYAAAYINRGVARSDQGDLAGAISDYDQAIALDPQYAEAYNNRGVARSDRGDLAGAISDYDQAIALDPQYAAAYINRGVARSDQGDLAGAISDYDQAVALDPQFAGTYINRGNARSDQGDLAGAISDYDQAIALDPQFAGAYINRGNARSDQGDLAGAISDYDQAIALDPQYAAAYNNRGTARSEHGDLAGAISDYDQAIALDPQYAAAYNNRGNARREQGDLAGAIRDYDQAIALDPQDAATYINRGVARSDQGDLAGAIRDYDQAIALDPQDAAAYNNRGTARSEHGDLAGAIRDYDQAIALDPQYAVAYNNRGNARREQGELAGAISDYDQAIALDPQFAVGYYNRGIARREQGDLAGAISDLTRHLELAPDAANRVTVEQIIAELRSAE